MQPTMMQIAARMIAEVLQRGHTPLTFLMSEATANRIADDLESEAKRRMSAAQRLWFWLRKGKGGRSKLTHLCGVPVTEAPHIPPGRLYLQTSNPATQSLGVPAGLEQAAEAAAEENGRRGLEFWEKQPVAAPGAAAGDAAPTLNDLASKNSGVPSVTDILIKALENTDDLKQVVVIRVHRNDDVDLSMNCNQFEAGGVLQKAHQWLMMRGY